MLTALAITGETAPRCPTSISRRDIRNKPQDGRSWDRDRRSFSFCLHALQADEDRYGAQAAQEYVDFIRQEPWYLFDFGARLRHLWSDVPM
ncbi:hypothetical protein PQQ86_33890 [Paraburkholderia sediminicola]|uniref:hypothetical protein n=1 Tax=Paraburkholderia sediminicola TaxID=458836 RepID=UPI0038BBFB4A